MEWISVNDRLPKDRTKCLVYGEIIKYDISYYHKGFYIGNEFVTHWMPLPEPPKGNKD